MSRIPGLRRVFRVEGGAGQVQREIEEEVAFHLEMRIRDLVARGMAPDAARAEAERRFGDVRGYRAELGAIDEGRRADERRAGWWDAFSQDLRHSLRGLRRQPGFTAVVVLTLALGIGANATMVGVLDQLLLRPPAHVRAPEELLRLGVQRVYDGVERSTNAFSYAVYRDVQAALGARAQVAAQTFGGDFPLGRGADAQKVRGSMVSGNYFTTLGVRPVLGRFILPEDDALPEGQPVAVIGHGFWQRELGGRADVLGTTLELGPRRYTIVGVAPRGFAGIGREALDVWLPIAAAEGLRYARGEWHTNRNAIWLSLLVRPTGATPPQVAAQATAAYVAGESADRGEAVQARAELESIMPRVARRESRDAKVSVLLAGVSLLVLLIACANVANLLLARGLRRSREIAVRLALGVSRRRLVAQLLTESLVLAALGGVAALAVVQWGGAAVRALLFGSQALAGAPVDARILAFTAAATLLTGVVTGLVPALQASRPAVTGALRAGAREGGGRRARTRTTLLVVQAALSVVLLAGTGLFVRSLARVEGVDLGIDTERLLIGSMDLGSAQVPPPQRDALFREMAERVRAIPGVSHVAVGVAVPFDAFYGTMVILPGRDSTPEGPNGSPNLNAVTAEFFPTAGVRIVRGRGFTAADREGSERVAVVSEGLARLYWPDGEALGQCMKLGADTMPCTTVVGIAEEVHQEGILEEQTQPQMYLPLGQETHYMRGVRTLYVRPAGDPARVVPAVRQVMQTAAPNLPFAEVRLLHDLLATELRPWRLGAAMFGAFGALALLLAAVGLYGVIAYGVAQRSHEIGVRMALGARGGDVVRMVVRQGVVVALAGAAVGVLLALIGGRFVQDLLYATSARDPLVLGGVVLVLLTVAVIASLVPARRASRVDPVTALKSE